MPDTSPPPPTQQKIASSLHAGPSEYSEGTAAGGCVPCAQPPQPTSVRQWRAAQRPQRRPESSRWCESRLPAFLQLGQDLEADRAVPGDDERIVERMDHGLSTRDRQPLCSTEAKKANTQTSRDECASPSEPSGRPNERVPRACPPTFGSGAAWSLRLRQLPSENADRSLGVPARTTYGSRFRGRRSAHNVPHSAAASVSVSP